ncbi:MAG: hypothetical protein GEU78_02680 [Actinobacteria bacterium]|nr:hypothetical protein [Actinomycetota bacterium]
MTETIERLSSSPIDVLGVLPYASNYTFLARVGEEDGVLAVYKPRRGERPLWDFQHGTLANREVAAYLVSDIGGFDLVPPTVLRHDAPLGPGSLQLFVEHDPERHYFALETERADDFRVLAAFDVVVNNADRKAGHVLEDAGGKLWAVDHGVTFHVEPKLRTVIWSFAEEPLPAGVRMLLERLRDALSQENESYRELAGLLSAAEADAVARRVHRLLRKGTYPQPEVNYPLPWPLV